MIYSLVFGMSRTKKRVISLFIDVVLLISAFFLAYWTRLGGIVAFDDTEIWTTLLCTIAITLFTFIKLGLYRAVLRYISFKALAMVAGGAFVSAVSLIFFSFFIGSDIPRTVPIIYFSYVFLLCGSARMLIRYYVSLILDKDNESVLIYGAGTTGRQLAVLLKHTYRYRIRGFIDDNAKLHGTYLLGNKIFSPNDISKLVQKYNVKVILLAIPSASRSERKAIIDSLIPLKIKVQTIPDMEEILQGNAKIDELREVNIEDLLGREPVLPNKDLLQKNILHKVVMVTGAGGSIGSELCRQIILNEPNILILFEVSEFSLYSIHQELLEIAKKNNVVNTKIYPVLGNVQDIERLDRVLSHFSIDTIYHAAAYKHVPLVEYNMIEGVQNNVFGTYNVARCAAEHGVKSFVLISTDKAVRPTNVMGASKRMAELCLQALSEQLKDYQTCFSMVRFGNVLGSSGSVIPLFRKQILKGGPITITHPDIIRYFMTIPEAVSLVLQAGAYAHGGEIFILDMGKPVKILDMAKNLIKLSGLEPDVDIEIKFIGLRPGEKLYEEMLMKEEGMQTTPNKMIHIGKPIELSHDFFDQLDHLYQVAYDEDSNIRKEVHQMVDTYHYDENTTHGIK